MELRAQIAAITSSSKEGEQAEAEAGEGTGPQVTDQHIADIVAQWTGIPIDKVRSLNRRAGSSTSSAILCLNPMLQFPGVAESVEADKVPLYIHLCDAL